MKREASLIKAGASLCTVSILLLILLTASFSCDSGSRYVFQPESMHWTQFRGPGSSGIAPPDADPPVHFSADTNLLWKTEILPGWSSPCIVNERIFLTGFDKADSLLITMALDREDGEILWLDSVSLNKTYFIHPTTTHANPTAVSDGKMIYTHFPAYGLLAYDLEGSRVWEFTHEELSQPLYGGSASPVIAGGELLLLVNSMTDPRLVGLDLQSGDTTRVFRADGLSWAHLSSNATPVIHGDLLILHLVGSIAAVNLGTLEAEWWLNTLTTGIATPVIEDNMIYLNTWSQLGEKKTRGELLSFAEFAERCDDNGDGIIERDEIHKDLLIFSRSDNPDDLYSTMYYRDDLTFAYFDSNKDEAFEKSEWDIAYTYLHNYIGEHGMIAFPIEGSGERPVMDIRWKVTENTPESPSPLLLGDKVLFIDDGGDLTVLNRNTGDVAVRERIKGAGAYFASPLLAGNRVYMTAHNGTINVLSADDFSVMAQNKLKEKIGASPVAVDDVLYVRTDKHLYAFRN